MNHKPTRLDLNKLKWNKHIARKKELWLHEQKEELQERLLRASREQEKVKEEQEEREAALLREGYSKYEVLSMRRKTQRQAKQTSKGTQSQLEDEFEALQSEANQKLFFANPHSILLLRFAKHAKDSLRFIEELHLPKAIQLDVSDLCELLQHFDFSCKLRKLSLVNQPAIASPRALGLIEKFAGLRFLNVSRCDLDNSLLKALLSQCSSLETLLMSNNPQIQYSDDSLSLSVCPQLVNLSLTCYSRDNEDLIRFIQSASLNSNSRLSFLILDGGYNLLRGSLDISLTVLNGLGGLPSTEEVISLVERFGVDVDILDVGNRNDLSEAKTLLERAIRHNNIQLARCCLELGAVADLRVYAAAAAAGHDRYLRMLDRCTVFGTDDVTHPWPLHEAVSSGSHKAVRHLLKRGFSPNVLKEGSFYSPGQTYHSDTIVCSPYQLAIKCQQTNIAMLLLEWGADPNLCDNYNPVFDMISRYDTPPYQLYQKSVECGLSLVTVRGGSTPLLLAVKLGSLEWVELLLESGVTVNGDKSKHKCLEEARRYTNSRQDYDPKILATLLLHVKAKKGKKKHTLKSGRVQKGGRSRNK
ncbi:Ankyrin repeat domain-containing protein 7, variant 2 [Balamuthia mandrillaris]